MSRSCERPGCSQPAAVIYGFSDGEGRLEVWLDAWSDDSSDRGADVRHRRGAHGAVCERHGELLSPPLGWVLVDRREDVPRLFVPRPVLVYARSDDPSSPVGRTIDTSAELRRRRVADLPTPQLFVDAREQEDDSGEWGREEHSTTVREIAVREIIADDEIGSASVLDVQSADPDSKLDRTPDEDLSTLLDATGPLLRRAFSKRNTGLQDPSRELMRPTHVVIDESA